MRRKITFLVLVALSLIPSLTEARLTQLVITSSPAFGGQSFGQVGPYESLVGYARGELNPKDPLNQSIVDIDKALKNSKGLVEYQMDVYIFKPVDIKKGNGRVFYDVLNRGRKLGHGLFNLAPADNDPTNPGDGFLMKQGYAFLWSGFSCTYPYAGGAGDGSRLYIGGGNPSKLMVADFPIAKNSDGSPLVGLSRDEFIPDTSYPLTATSYIVNLTYPAADLEPAKATLTVREHQTDPRQKPPGMSWKYLNEWQIEITRPSDTVAFDNGAIYEFIYLAKDPQVNGMAYASLRDLISYLRYGAQDDLGNPNPLAPGGKPIIEKAIAFGMSQSGRYIKNFIYEGFNQDEHRRMVFDGVISHVGGARLNWLNSRFSQTGAWSRQHEEHYQVNDQFPFTYTNLYDPISGKTDGILVKCQEQGKDEHEGEGSRSRGGMRDRDERKGTCPKIMHTDGDGEMWAARASLVVTDTKGNDIDLPENVRAYYFSATQHSAGSTPAKGICQQLTNPLDYRPLLRALLVAMDQWVTCGIKPPDTRYPHRHDGTLVSSDQASTGFPSIPGVNYSGLHNFLQLTDYNVQPPAVGAFYPVYIAKVDQDGNAVAGIRLPDVEAPLATYTGWNIRGAGYAEGELCSGTNGLYIPFARTKADRQCPGPKCDPRPSIEERYKNHDDYVRKVARAAHKLIKDRLLLWEDAERNIEAAEASDIGK